ncbi:MAG TPA: Gp19/Gp15/Gp42 family protein [Pseudonocardia sp.]|uniref:Gp19/Gp15/Gp42 family protein n=1 Tax=Pseudonocardia sp. TaxID=60912 RepID=UPI002BF3B70A|nr:Gp19/Gp15/Gp42 family protein [Pseudonocardia sp.]HTF54488.1 Gp19/Gp15/Gp42 family protein [Pseudonocardia sp.]
MSLPALADIADLEVRLDRIITDDETPRVEALLDDVSVMVREVAGKTWVDPEDPTQVIAPDIVRLIVLRASVRFMTNPGGLSSESAGDYSYQRNGMDARGGLFLTDEEIGWLKKVAGKLGIWSQPLTRGDLWASKGVFLEDSFGFELFPVGDPYDC